MRSDDASPRLRWYQRPAWILVLLFAVLGPLGLPQLWRSPSFSRTLKIALTVLVAVLTVVLLDETIRVYRVLRSEMDTLGTLTTF